MVGGGGLVLIMVGRPGAPEVDNATNLVAPAGGNETPCTDSANLHMHFMFVYICQIENMKGSSLSLT